MPHYSQSFIYHICIAKCNFIRICDNIVLLRKERRKTWRPFRFRDLFARGFLKPGFIRIFLSSLSTTKRGFPARRNASSFTSATRDKSSRFSVHRGCYTFYHAVKTFYNRADFFLLRRYFLQRGGYIFRGLIMEIL